MGCPCQSSISTNTDWTVPECVGTCPNVKGNSYIKLQNYTYISMRNNRRLAQNRWLRKEIVISWKSVYRKSDIFLLNHRNKQSKTGFALQSEAMEPPLAFPSCTTILIKMTATTMDPIRSYRSPGGAAGAHCVTDSALPSWWALIYYTY